MAAESPDRPVPLTPRGKLGSAARITVVLGAVLGATGFLLQALGVFPAGDSPGKTRFKILLFAVVGVYWLLYALAEKDFSRFKATAFERWSLWLFAGLIVLALIVMAVSRYNR